MLRISPDLEFSLDAVTQKFAWLGRSGSGKTFACKRFVEQMLHAKAQVVVLDSVGVWFGLRQGTKGFDVPVFGGLYGDIPLDPASGALVAEVAVSHGASLVLDLSQMSDAGRARFAAAFGARLFELKKSQPGAMHLVLDEGQDYVPQDPEKSENLMLHEWVRIAKQGRAFGIGLSIVSQRPQEISKKALNQAECVVAFQLTGPHERKALEYWLADKGLETKLSTTLTTLEVGRPFVWSPQWLKMSKVIERVLPIDSADTSQTPQVGDAPRRVSTMKPIDLGALRVSMAAAAEEAKENDPKLLRARIAELEKVAKGGVPVARIFNAKRAEALVLRAGHARQERMKMINQVDVYMKDLKMDLDLVRDGLDALQAEAEHDRLGIELEEFFDASEAALAPSLPSRAKPPLEVRQEVRSPRKKSDAVEAAPTSTLPTGETAVLVAAFQYGARGAPMAAVALMTGYKTRSIQNYVVRLRAHESGALVDRVDGRLVITAAGKALVPRGTKALPRGKALMEHLIETLPEGESRILRLAHAAHPKPISMAEISADTSYALRSVQNYVVRLVSRRAIKRAGPGKIALDPEVLS